MTELASRYNFKEVDKKWSKYWESHNTFHAEANPKKPMYSIVIPPPNVTGILHMGHALNNTLQDIIIRYKRMNGFEAMWMPGTDHAGIATQNVVEKQLAKEGKTRDDIGREAFLERLWDWKQQYGDTIIHQLKQLGASCDWPRTRFTMDDKYSQAVMTTFVKLYEKGLIYRGEYIINWCPRCLTALSDEEAEHKDTQGKLYHIKYPFKDDPKKYVVVATTRPETMLGDTAVAINPMDERYKNLIGKTLILPLVNREIKIIKDDFVDPAFGTGAVKVTPAHDPNDFAMGKRHNLAFVNVMHPNAVINKNGGQFNNLDRFEARKKIITALEAEGLLEKIEDHLHAVGHCYRCDTIIEPYLSKQWFVKMQPLAKPAIKAVEEDKIKFYPDRWTKVYMNWMENIRDWCISRQIWWGHRIPVWYDEDGNYFVAMNEAQAKQQAKAKHGKDVPLTQDNDVLDTWFSSWLWPFATLGWPEENKDLNYFYPTSSLFTASEIIFFWVARMIMAGFEFRGDIPFSDVYIHGTVRDAKGRKMSKSLGNAIDPLEIIDEYGADSLRFSLIINSGQDLFISKEKFEIGRNFANKVWNASRLILMNAGKPDGDIDFKDFKKYDLPTRWIISRFYETLESVNTSIERFRFSEAESLVYEFFWNNFCDWYLEIIKDKWNDKTIQQVALKLLEDSIKIIHPFMPFVTEEIWQHLNINDKCLAIQEWPKLKKDLIDKSSLEEMNLCIELVTALRNLRAQWNIKAQEKIPCHLSSLSKSALELLKNNVNLLENAAKLSKLVIEPKLSIAANTAIAVVGEVKCAIPLGELIDIEKEKKRILSQLTEQEKLRNNLISRLQSENFVSKAPQEVIGKEKERLANIELKIKELDSAIKNIN